MKLSPSQPESLQYHWWSAYGRFNPGENGFPHIGQVIRHYRKMRGMDIKSFAQELKISTRRAYELEETVIMPKSIKRRQALATLLGIPVALLNIPEHIQVQPLSLHPAKTMSNIIVHPDAMQAYEGVLDLAWGAYYTSNSQRSAQTVDYWRRYLLTAINDSQGISQDQLIALYCRFSQLGGVIARDRLAIDGALALANKAVEAALQLNNADLIASALFRRAKIHVGQMQYQRATKDAEAALRYAGRSRDPLKCYVSVFLAEVYSLSAPQDRQLQNKSLELLDDAERMVRSAGVLENDGSYVKVDLPGLFIIKGDVYRRQGKISDAQDALEIVGDHLPPQMTRWRGNLRISEAQLALVARDIDGSCQFAMEALGIAVATQSDGNKRKIERLYKGLTRVAPKHVLVKDLGDRLSLR